MKISYYYSLPFRRKFCRLDTQWKLLFLIAKLRMNLVPVFERPPVPLRDCAVSHLFGWTEKPWKNHKPYGKPGPWQIFSNYFLTKSVRIMITLINIFGKPVVLYKYFSSSGQRDTFVPGADCGCYVRNVMSCQSVHSDCPSDHYKETLDVSSRTSSCVARGKDTFSLPSVLAGSQSKERQRVTDYYNFWST